MSSASPLIREFSRQLIAFEAARDRGEGTTAARAVRVCDRLRTPLAKLAGVDGFRTLMARALAVAKADVPSLATAEVRPDGTVFGLAPTEAEAGVAVVAHLLDLLVTFIGKPLVLQLVREAWPELPATATDLENGGRT